MNTYILVPVTAVQPASLILFIAVNFKEFPVTVETLNSLKEWMAVNLEVHLEGDALTKGRPNNTRPHSTMLANPTALEKPWVPTGSAMVSKMA
ncbi:hypothetical protein EYF80_013325 [Liparis tanakae]|uniref:Uncharacterized protein n=1 Tax=Liparis tanakae TaxID=230148 RepID=A0A4Z2IEZ9_9TELE|nr:hypothetical protein EYF80_013325 [Liparis tanakae]